MTNQTFLLGDICRRWFGEQPVRLSSTSLRGFSGSSVILVEPAESRERFILKAFPAAATVENARWVQSLVRHLRAEGLGEIPEAMAALDGRTLIQDGGGRLWEMQRFMPGTPACLPSGPQAAAAAAYLARIHAAGAGLPGHGPRPGIPPAVDRRIERARALRMAPWRRRRDRIQHAKAAPGRREFLGLVGDRFEAAIAIFADFDGTSWLDRIAAVRRQPLVLQPVLRDIWCDHVRYGNPHDRVTAIIDLHAAAIDTPATDVARLLGSWEARMGCEPLPIHDRWPEAMAAYERMRPLSRLERRLVLFLHATGVLFGLDNWFRWTLDERREFPDAGRVLARIDGLLCELPHAVAAERSRDGNVD